MEQIQFLTGDADTLNELYRQKPYIPFAQQTIVFLDAFYQTLRKENQSLQAADIAALAFWCRRSHLYHLRDDYERKWQGMIRLGRGISFHIVPSNIPVLFAFSMATALLAGNTVILRLPEKSTVQEELILSALKQVMEQQPEWKKRIVIVRYGHRKDVTDTFSQMCQVRVIWGGDNSILEIQQSKLQPGTPELTFADRRSAAVFSAEYILMTENLTDILRGFYNDTYLNDQNACSSPSLIYWTGKKDEVYAARKKFWTAAFDYIQAHYKVDAHIAVQKWEQALYLTAINPTITMEKCENAVVLMQCPELTEELWEQTVPGGFFFESSGETLSGLYPVLTGKCQMLTCVGVNRNQIALELLEAGVSGVDRIVENGHALDFSLIWDGKDLMEYLIKIISV